MATLEERIVDLVATGPRTGAELREALGAEVFATWKACMLSARLTVRRVGRRYMRLDRKVEGLARLSPSILREFLTYSVVGLSGDDAACDERVAELERYTAQISSQKLALATAMVTEIATPLVAGHDVEPLAILMAGDVVFGMAHDVSRPERSTGAMVQGSDLDIVVIVRDDAPEDLVRALDDAIYGKKYQFLRSPAFREEIDYIVKRCSKLREQMQFDTFQRMVACKILDESILIFGSEELFQQAKEMLCASGVVDRLREMERAAVVSRAERESYLLSTDEDILRASDLFIFYTDDESEEFE